MMLEWIDNQATVELTICGKTLTFKSNLVKIKIRRKQEVTVRLQSRKVVCGTCLLGGQFKFIVCDKHRREVAHAHHDNNGDITFPELTFNHPGVYTYTIQESRNFCECWVLDHRCYSAVVTVRKCQQGRLIATVSYPDGFPVFVNRYCPNPLPCCKSKDRGACCCEKMYYSLRC